MRQRRFSFIIFLLSSFFLFFLFFSTSPKVAFACDPPGSSCGSCTTQTCPDGSACATGNSYCVWDSGGNYCGGCSEEVNNCASCGSPPPPSGCRDDSECPPETRGRNYCCSGGLCNDVSKWFCEFDGIDRWVCNSYVYMTGAGHDGCGGYGCSDDKCNYPPAPTCNYNRTYNECCSTGYSRSVQEYTYSNGSGVCKYVVGACNQADAACGGDPPPPGVTCDYNRTYNQCCATGLSESVQEYTYSNGSGACKYVVGACNQADAACGGSGYCGDGSCNNGENCSTCSDCGSCDDPPPPGSCYDGGLQDTYTTGPCSVTIRHLGFDNNDGAIGGYTNSSNGSTYRTVNMNDSDLSCKSNINLQFTNNWGASGGRNFSITDTINSKDAWNTLGAGWQLNSAGCTINDCSATQVGPSQRTTNSGSDTYPATLYYCGDGQCACGENSSTCSADCAPSAPTGLNASCSALGTSVTLSWGAVSGETYYVVRVGVVGQPTTEYTVSGASTSYTPSRPGESVTYNWWVKACNSAGCSSETKGPDFACVGNVSGIVYEDQKNNCPASGAPVLGGVVVTVFTSPSKTTTTDAGGNYAINDLAAGSWAITATKTDYTPSVCSANSVTIESGRTATLDLYLRPPLPWFQTQGGDVHSQQNIYSKIPSLLNTYFSLDQYSYPGVVSYGGSSASFGLTPVSTRGWRPNSSLTFAKYNYDYFYKRLGAPTVDDFSCGSGCPTPPLGVTTAYYSADSVTIDRNNSWTIPANTKVMVLVNGDLNISLNPNNRRITVPVGSFLGFFVKGNINIDSAIGNKQTGYDVQPFLEGVYIVDGVIDTYASDLQGLGSGRRLIGAGIFYAKGGVLLKRELKSNPDPLAMQNSNTPAELFIFRPDLVMNSPRELWTGNLNWIEVAP